MTPYILKSLRVFGIVLAVAWCAGAGLSAAEPAPVTLTDDGETATLANGVVSLTVRKANGNIVSLRRNELELISRGGGYWNIYGATPGSPNTERKGIPSVFHISEDPRSNGGARGEIALRFPYLGQANTVPLDIEIRYTLHRGDTGVYGWTIADHRPEFPAFNIEVSTVCLKLNPELFDFLSVDAKRQRPMATAEDWVAGTQLNLWEARRLNTGIRKGEVEHKYDYNALFSETPAWGWSSTKRKVGLFIVNPSIEYINAPPTMVDYGGHIDVKATLPADPCLLFIWHSPHYGGRGVEIKAGERWQKIVGPFLIYTNSGETPEVMWKDALVRADREKKNWPYGWAEASGYARSNQRGRVSGQLAVIDPQARHASAAGAWVGLAQPPYRANLKNGPLTIEWQTDGKHYQYWARADPDGRFEILNARPGVYTLYAFNDGILGEFSQADVRVEAGKPTELGQLQWTPARNGRTLWEIGVPNRSAEEFRHGDHFWQWGLYNLYPQDFPNGVDFVIGKSDPRRDWNYAQPPTPDGPNRWKSTKWRIRFDASRTRTGTASLRLAICGARGGPVDVSVNGQAVGGTGELPESGVMHRDGIRATALTERTITFDAALLKDGENVIELTKQARAWTDGVLYDYLRLELDSDRAFTQ